MKKCLSFMLMKSYFCEFILRYWIFFNKIFLLVVRHMADISNVLVLEQHVCCLLRISYMVINLSNVSIIFHPPIDRIKTMSNRYLMHVSPFYWLRLLKIWIAIISNHNLYLSTVVGFRIVKKNCIYAPLEDCFGSKRKQ